MVVAMTGKYGGFPICCKYLHAFIIFSSLFNFLFFIFLPGFVISDPFEPYTAYGVMLSM